MAACHCRTRLAAVHAHLSTSGGGGSQQAPAATVHHWHHGSLQDARVASAGTPPPPPPPPQLAPSGGPADPQHRALQLQLLRDGFCVVPDVLGPGLLAELRKVRQGRAGSTQPSHYTEPV